jgi:hypothetical protein
VKIYVAAVKTLREKERQDEPPKLVEKLVWVPVISLCKIPIPSYGFGHTRALYNSLYIETLKRTNPNSV